MRAERPNELAIGRRRVVESEQKLAEALIAHRSHFHARCFGALHDAERRREVAAVRVEIDDGVEQRGRFLGKKKETGKYGLRVEAFGEKRGERDVLNRVGYDVVRDCDRNSPVGLDLLKEEQQQVVSAFGHEGNERVLTGVIVEGGEDLPFVQQRLQSRMTRKPTWRDCTMVQIDL